MPHCSLDFIRIMSIAFLFLSLLHLTTVVAATPRVVSLDEAIKLAVEASPQIKEELFGVLIRESQRKQADAARFAQFDIIAVGGPSPRARGNQISSPDSKGNTAITGVFSRASFSLIQPLFTFGKINSFRQAATHGKAVSQAQVHQKATEVAMLVYKAYYGYQLARALENLAVEIGEQLTTTLNNVRHMIKAEAPDVDNIDLYKLQTFEGELNKQLNDIRQGKGFALDGLRTLINLPPGTTLELSETKLQPVQQTLDTASNYLRDARQLRPEFAQAQEGVKAFAALVKAAKADYYPLFFAGVVGSLAEATNRDRFTNPFVFDTLNDDVAAPVLGFRWHYDLGITAGKVGEAKAKLGQVQQQRALAEIGIPFQVRQAIADVKRHQANITSTRNGYRNGRKWLVAALSNFDLGVGEGKDVADAAIAYAKLRASYFQAVHGYNLGLATLDHATGRDVPKIKSYLPGDQSAHLQPK